MIKIPDVIQNTFSFNDHESVVHNLYLNNFFPCLRHIKLWAIAINWQPSLLKSHSSSSGAQRYCTYIVPTYLPTYLKQPYLFMSLLNVFSFVGCCHRKPLLVPGGRAFVWPGIQHVQRYLLFPQRGKFS